MKKASMILAIVMALSVLAGCAGGEANTPSATAIVTGDINSFGGSFDAQVVHHNGFGLSFMLRNTSDENMYYGDGYRIYRYDDGQWQLNHAREASGGAYVLAPGVTRNISIQWGRYIADGTYKFVMSNGVEIEFDEVPWDDMPFEDMRQGRIDFITAGETSENITLAGEPEASPTGISFTLENRSDMDFGYGHPYDLVRYEDGRWLAVPFVNDAAFTMPLLTLRPGRSDLYAIDWGWIFGELPPGRYMFIRDFMRLDESFVEYDGEHETWSSIHIRYPTKEYLMIEFTID